MGKRLKKFFAIFVSVLFLTLCLFLLVGHRFLAVNDDDQVMNADAVVILAGGPNEDNLRIYEGVSLFEQGRVQYIILPLRHKTFTWSWVRKNYNVSESVPESKVLIGRAEPHDRQLIYQYGGTFVEARKTVKIMHRLHLSSAIIVSSSYHMRRAKVAFESTHQDQHFQFFYHPVQNPRNNEKPWWMNKKYMFRVLREYKKLIAAYFIYKK
jgi:uncharacterized SAM-binding protein YcdF (DUF218 family)